MRGFTRLFPVLGLVILLSLAPAQPARAAYIVHDPTSLAKLLADSAKAVLDTVKGFFDAIGAVGTGLPQNIGTVDGTPIVDPCAGKAWTSLTQYFELCLRPTQIKLAQAGANNMQQFMAADSAMRRKENEAQAQINHKQDVNKMNVQGHLNVLTLDESFCRHASLSRSTIAQIFRANIRYNTMLREAARQNLGSEEFPAFAKGPGQFNQDYFNTQISEGLVLCTGNDGANANIPGCVGSDVEYVGADADISTLLGAWSLEEEPKKRHSLRYARMLVDNNLFDSRSFSPIDKAQLDQRTGRAAQLMTNRTAYGAKISTFMTPFIQQIAERAPDEGLASIRSLEAQLDTANIQGAEREKLIKQAKASLSASDFIRYSVLNLDPKTTVDLAGRTGANAIALQGFQAERSMEQVSLLYDIRETLKMTNMLLGLMGGVLLKDEYQALQSGVQTVSSNSLQ